MKRLLGLLMSLMAFLPTTAWSDSALETSPGGLRFGYLPMPKADRVSIQVAWPSDWAFRADANQAVPLVGADLILAGGAEGYPAGKVVEEFADLKAVGTLSATAGEVIGSLTVPKEHLSEALKIANAHLRVPSLDQGWMDRISSGLLAKATEESAKPTAQTGTTLRWAILGDTPLRHLSSLDPPSQISDVTRDEITQWYRQTLLRNTAIVVVAGPLTKKEAGKAIDALLNGLPEGEAKPTQVPSTNFSPRRVLLHVPTAETSALSFVAPFPALSTGSEMEDILLVSALGGNDQSVLFNAVRTNLRGSYAFGASLDGFTRDSRFLIMSGQVDTAKLAAAEDTVRKAYGSFLETGLSGDLAKRKLPLSASLERNDNDAAIRAFAGLMSLRAGRDPADAQHLKSILDKVDDASVAARLNSAYPQPKDFTVLAVSPDPKALPGACVITQPKDALNCR